MATAPAPRDLVSEFHANGYAVIDLVDFHDAAGVIINGLVAEFDSTHRIENAWRSSEEVRRLATLPEVLAALLDIYGRPAFPFQTLNFNRGTEQATHSDTIHFDSTPAGFMAGVWIALEDIDAGNGPLRVYPGTHTLPQLTLKDFGIDSLGGRDPHVLYKSVYEPGIARIVKERGLKPHEIHLRKGQALIWAANILHGGQPIIDTARTRHSQVTHYFFEGCAYHSPLLSSDGNIHRRYPVDITTGRNVGGEVDGQRIAVPLRQRLRSWVANRARRGTRHQR